MRRYLLAICCLLAAVATAQVLCNIHSCESLEFQAINSYLTNLNLPQQAVVPVLYEAIDLIEFTGVEAFATMSKETDKIESKFSPLLGSDPRTVLAILKNLVSASKSCDQEATSFLALVAEQQTFHGQFLNQYAHSLLDKCQSFNLSQLSSRLQRAVGKMDANLFDMIDSLANKVANIEKRKQASSRGTLAIYEQQPALDANVTTLIKQLDFERVGFVSLLDALTSLLAEVVAQDDSGEKLDYMEKKAKLCKTYLTSIAAPCEEALSRIVPIMTDSLQANPQASALVSEAIRQQRESDPALDYLLEIYRICRGLKSNKERVLRVLYGST